MKHHSRNARASLGAMGPRLSLLLCVLAFPLGAQQPRDEYVVTFTERAPLTIAVEARVTSIDGTLHVEPYTSQDEGFWRSRVTGLAVFDSAGGRLGVDSATPTSWHLRGASRGRVTLRYVVDVSFASRPFPSGNQKAGYTDGKALYLTTRPLFVTPDTGDGAMARDVQFVVPGGWRVETPWEKTGVARYRAMSRRDLAYNTIVVGRFATPEVRLGKLRMVAAFLGPVARDSAVIGDAFVRAAREYFRIFPDTPAGNYLMTVFYADHDDGEAFASACKVLLARE